MFLSWWFMKTNIVLWKFDYDSNFFYKNSFIRVELVEDEGGELLSLFWKLKKSALILENRMPWLCSSMAGADLWYVMSVASTDIFS